MSAGAVYQRTLRLVNRAALPDNARRDLVTALEAARPGTLGLTYEIAHEAGLPREELLTRTAAVFLNFAAGNLADDLADGECTWLDDAARRGPGLQYLMQNLFFSAAVEGGLDAAAVGEVSALLVAASARQQDEVRREAWTAERYRAVAEGIFGLQWAAYLRLLWHGTSYAPRAKELGVALGVATNVIRDRDSGDSRLLSMPETDRRAVAAWALGEARVAQSAGLAWLRHAVAPAMGELEQLAGAAARAS